MKQRLNVILDQCKNDKFRHGFVKYLSVLDFDEFEKVYDKYVGIIIRLIIRYNNKNIKFLSKDWLKNKILRLKWSKLHNIFVDSNSNFVVKINDNDKIQNIKTSKLLSDIKELINTLKNINESMLTIDDYSNPEDRIRFYILLSDTIYINAELETLTEELYKN